MYDYIVVGGGSSGSVVAGELAADPSLRVLVLEHGDAAERNPETLEAAGYKKAFINERLMFDRFSVPQPGCAGHVKFMGSGRGMGGSGAINAMVYTRGSAFDYESWATSGWRWSDVVPAFERLEARLQIHRMPPTRFTEACIAAAELAGFRRKEDLNDGTLTGFLGYEWMNVAGADRRSSYVAFLKPRLQQPNLTVLTNAAVQRVLFDGHRRAVGVEYLHEGEVHTAQFRSEIILCAGALETPKLLMLSGVGPAKELRAHKIPLVCDAPGVGQNLGDHPNVSVFFRGKQPTDCSWAQLYGFHRTNPETSLPAGEADSCYVFYSAKSSFREGVVRMLPGMILPQALYRNTRLPSLLRSLLKGVFSLSPVRSFVERMYGVVVILGKPSSRGTVRLRSADANDHPLVDPNYFADPEDLATLVKGVRRAREITGAAPLARWGNLELLPGRRAGSDEKIADFIRKNVMTTFHYTGTCRMGDGADAVVTPQLQLRGVTGVRIADASVIPVGPVSAMNAPSMLIGFRAAELIHKDRAARAAGGDKPVAPVEVALT
jgi:choline dehydrogenase